MSKRLIFIPALLLVCCSSKESRVVTNETGKHSIKVLAGWEGLQDGKNTRVIKPENKRTGNGSIFISVIESDFETLEESHTNYIRFVKQEFGAYEKVSEGVTQINGIPATWHRMKDTQEGIRYITVQYLMQPAGKTLFVINCSATEHTFPEFEENFTEMAFSFRLSQ